MLQSGRLLYNLILWSASSNNNVNGNNFNMITFRQGG